MSRLASESLLFVLEVFVKLPFPIVIKLKFQEKGKMPGCL